MKRNPRTWLLALAFLPLWAMAPATAQSQSSDPATDQSIDQGEGLDLQGVDIRAFIQDVSRATGSTFILDPRVQGTVTLTSQDTMSPSDLLGVLLATLRAQSLVAIPTGPGSYRIVPDEGAAQQPNSAGDELGFTTEVFRLRHVDARTAAETLKSLVGRGGVVAATPEGNSLLVADYADNLRRIRALITAMTERRAAEIAAGTAPDDLATKIMTTADPVTGETFDTEEMVDQVAIFFLAGHETSASALAWALYLLALFPDWQERVTQEAAEVCGGGAPGFADVGRLRVARDVFRDTLRLSPPVPMMVREAACPERFRDREVPRGSQIVLSPWHLHRHERLWERPDEFDPARFATENGKSCLRNAYMPFSAGQRVCTGAGFAMIEGPLILSMLVGAFRFDIDPNRPAMPVAHLTVRGKDGIWLKITPRA